MSEREKEEKGSEMENDRFSMLEVDDVEVAPPTPAAPVFKPFLPVAAPKLEVNKLGSQLVALDAGEQETGSIVYWSLSGEMRRDVIEAALRAEGFDETWVPRATSERVALREAARACAGTGRLLREHPAGGWALVDEKVENMDLKYSTMCRIYLNKEGQLRGVGPIAHEIAKTVRDAYDTSLQQVENVSTWLVNCMARMRATVLRATGGFYFVPKEHSDMLKRFMKAMHNATAHKIYRVPAMRSADMVEAVFDAMVREVADAVKAAQEAVQDDSKGKRAAASLAGELDKLVEKIAGYERLLGVSLGTLSVNVKEVQTRLREKASRWNQLEVE